MLGKIYYANVYSVACFAISLLLVAFKKNKSVVIFVSPEHLTEEEKMQTACLQYPNFYGFVLWNLDVLNSINNIFLQ